MTSFYSQEELMQFGFQALGENVLISKKASIYGAEKMTIGSNVRIDDFCLLSGSVHLGNYIHIAAYSAIYGGNRGVFVDDFANISSRVTIYSVSDDYSGESMTNPMIPDKFKKVYSAAVYLERHVIIGASSVVLPGTTLKEGSSFGSFSLIKQDAEPWSINIGIPCKKVKDRKKDLLEMETAFKREFLKKND